MRNERERDFICTVFKSSRAGMVMLSAHIYTHATCRDRERERRYFRRGAASARERTEFASAGYVCVCVCMCVCVCVCVCVCMCVRECVMHNRFEMKRGGEERERWIFRLGLM